ncbi:NACHT domain-containing protein [Novipirellula sp. SH528]|uniref:NACHT domain-containing protein n=1 Tax=Novipirellula sp. SH528 TaxID=3454466 RepID=UPI003FA12608
MEAKMIEAQSPMQQAFVWLATAEWGDAACRMWCQSTSAGSIDERSLRHRVESLAILLDILPRRYRSEIESIVQMWCKHFPAAPSVSIDELREVTRRWLRLRKRKPAKVPNYFAAAVSIAQPGGQTIPEQFKVPSSSVTHLPTGSEHQCVYGLQTWFEQLHRKQCWTHIPSVVPGDKPVPIHEMFVELFLQTDLGYEEDPRTAVTRTLQRCVIVGAPGSGKSTLVQWLAHTIAESGIGDFDVPVVIKLKDYAQALAKQPDLSPLEFFFTSLGRQDLDPSAASAWLRHVSRDQNRVLLMCDGWDEVPAAQRANLREQLERESDVFVTLITSRPAGLPQSLRVREDVDFYRIGELKNRSMVQLTKNIFASRLSQTHQRVPDATQAVARIQSSAELRTLAKTPLFLGQIVHVFADAASSNTIPLATGVIAQLVAWMRKYPQFSGDHANEIKLQHLQALSLFSHKQVFEHQREHALFHEIDVQQATATIGVSESAIFSSRLLNRGNAMIDEYQFSDQAFQSYFAALRVAELDDVSLQNALFDQAIQSQNRSQILNHAAVLSEPFRNVCLERTKHWLRSGDAFHQILLRLAKLAIVSRHAQRSANPNDSLSDWSSMIELIRNKLWHSTEESCNPNATRMYVETLAELDPAFLIWKTTSNHNLDEFVLQLIRRYVPHDACCNLDSATPTDSQSPSHEGNGSATKQHGDAPLRPIQRDGVLRQLAAFPANYPVVKHGIETLAGQPVCDGANVLMEIASVGELHDDLRAKAIEISLQSADRSLVDFLVDEIQLEQGSRTQSALLRLAIEREIALDLNWLERQIIKDASQELRSLRLHAYFSSMVMRSPEQRQQMSRFLNDLTLSALQSDHNHLRGLLAEYFRPDWEREFALWFDYRVATAVMNRVVRFTKTPELHDIDSVLFAARILVAVPGEGKRVHLNKVLDAALGLVSPRSSRHASDDALMKGERFATSIAKCLVEVAPGILLRYEPSCRPVQNALQDAALAKGWLIFKDRILDKDGIEIAVRSDVLPSLNCCAAADADVIDEIVQDLPPRQRDDFLSYWHMVSEGDADYALTEREQVHEAICTLMASDLNTDLSERLWSCYQEGKPPSFASWKKNLARVVQRYEDRPELLAHLQQLGLGIHKRKPR